MQHRKSVTTQIGFHLPIRLVERLDEASKRVKRTKVSIVTSALEGWLEQHAEVGGGQELDGEL